MLEWRVVVVNDSTGLYPVSLYFDPRIYNKYLIINFSLAWSVLCYESIAVYL